MKQAPSHILLRVFTVHYVKHRLVHFDRMLLGSIVEEQLITISVVQPYCEMIHSVCGLNADQVGLVVHALSHSDDKDLATLFITSLALIDTTLLLLLKEMFSTRKHILYWTQLAKSPSWEIYLYRLNSVVFKSVFVDKERDYLILNSSELMLRHAEMLRSDLSDLSILLEKVSVAASHLKAVYVQLNSVGGTMSDARRKLGLIKPGLQSESDFKVPEGNSFDDIGVKLGLSMVSVEDDSQQQPQQAPAHPARSVFGLSVPSEDDEWEIKDSAAEVLEQQQRVRFERRGTLGNGGGSGAEEELGLIRLGVRRELEQCLVGLAEAFAEYLPHLVLALPMPTAHPQAEKPQQLGQEGEAAVAGAPSPGLKLNPSGKRADLSLQELEDLYDRLETFLDTLRVTRGPKVRVSASYLIASLHRNRLTVTDDFLDVLLFSFLLFRRSRYSSRKHECTSPRTGSATGSAIW